MHCTSHMHCHLMIKGRRELYCLTTHVGRLVKSVICTWLHSPYGAYYALLLDYRCVDYVILENDEFGETESCGNETSESNVNQFLPGEYIWGLFLKIHFML